MSSNQSGSFAVFNFTGTEVHLSGTSNTDARVSVDGQSYSLSNAAGSLLDPTKFDLFQATDLSNDTSHTVILFNDGQSRTSHLGSLDLCSISWVTNAFSQNDTRFQDTIFSYQPPNSTWQTDTSEFPGSDSGSIHFTTQAGASATVSFFGDRIAVYGFVSSLGSPYTVQLDGGPVINLTGNRANLSNVPQQVLYQTTGLDSKDLHNLTLTAQPAEASQVFSIDYAIVDSNFNPSPSWPGPTSTVSAISQIPSDPISRLEKLRDPPVIVGISIAGALLLCAFILIFIRLHRRRRRRVHMTRQLTRHPLSVLAGVYKIEPLRFSGSFSRHLSMMRGISRNADEDASRSAESNINHQSVQHWYTCTLSGAAHDQVSSTDHH